jgi:hypothetical protein
MDRLNVTMDVLHRLVKEADDPNCVVLAERAINDYLKPEIDALKAVIEGVGKAIDEEAAKGQGEDWSWRVTFTRAVRSCPARSKNGRRTSLRFGNGFRRMARSEACS